MTALSWFRVINDSMPLAWQVAKKGVFTPWIILNNALQYVAFIDRSRLVGFVHLDAGKIMSSILSPYPRKEMPPKAQRKLVHDWDADDWRILVLANKLDRVKCWRDLGRPSFNRLFQLQRLGVPSDIIEGLLHHEAGFLLKLIQHDSAELERRKHAAALGGIATGSAGG